MIRTEYRPMRPFAGAARMEELGFRREIVEALRELDRKLFEAGKPLAKPSPHEVRQAAIFIREPLLELADFGRFLSHVRRCVRVRSTCPEGIYPWAGGVRI